MSLTCPVDLDVSMLRREVNAMYGRLATTPKGGFHFHQGFEYAVQWLGYDREALSRVPVEVTMRFAGVGNPLGIAPLRPGATVLDVGCGAGTDLLLAASEVGPRGFAIGVDMNDRMRDHALVGAARMGLRNVDVRDGDATALPIADRS